jgi:hypothetical protein
MTADIHVYYVEADVRCTYCPEPLASEGDPVETLDELHYDSNGDPACRVCYYSNAYLTADDLARDAGA